MNRHDIQNVTCVVIATYNIQKIRISKVDEDIQWIKISIMDEDI